MGTPASRAGEAATHYILRKLKDGAPIKTIENELLGMAKGKLEKTVLDKSLLTFEITSLCSS